MADIHYDSAILVTGMHRSGTSALARVLILLGGNSPAELLEASPNNARGFWESPQVNAVNNAILADRGTNWHSIMPLSITADPKEFGAIRDCVRSQFPDAARPVIKDPRLCRLGNAWRAALSSVSEHILFPMIVRSPAEVAASLTARNHLSTLSGALLWTRYVLDAERATRGASRGIISYSGLLADWRGSVDRLQSQIGSALMLSCDNAGSIEEFLSASLHRQQISGEETDAFVAPYPLIRDVWEIMQQWVELGRLGAGDLNALDRLRGDLDRIAVMTDEVLEANRILEKRLMDAKRHDDAGRLAGTIGASAELLEQMREEFQSQLHDVEANLSDLLRRTAKHAAVNLHELQAVLTAKQVDDAKRLESLSEHVGQLDARRATDQNMIADMLATIEYLREERETLTAELDGLRREREALNEQLSAIAYQLEESRADKSCAEADIVRYSMELEASENKVAALEDERSALTNQCDDLQREVAQLISENASSAAAFAAQEDELATHRSTAQAAAAERDARSEDLGRARAEVEDLSRARTRLSEQLADVQHRAGQELAASLADAQALRAELKEVVRKYRSTQATLGRTKTGLDLTRARLADSKELASEQGRELAQLKAQWHYRFVAMLVAVFGRWFQTSRKTRATMRQQAATIARSGLFDAAWYLERYPDVAATGAEPLEHYLQNGWRENRDPSPGFSVSRYLRSNPDVAAAGIDPLMHYIEFGQAEGRGARVSKLAKALPAEVRVVAAAAPVYAPTATSGEIALPRPAPQPEIDHDYPALRTALEKSASSALTLARFEQLSGIKSYAAPTWEHLHAIRLAALIDIWFVDALTLRMRQRAPGGVLAICQVALSEDRVEVLLPSHSGEAEIIDVRLHSAFHPLLLVGADDDGNLVPCLMPFPSLLRGGIHYPEFLAGADHFARKGSYDAFDLGLEYAEQLGKLRTSDAAPLIGGLAVDLIGATGAGPIFAPGLRSWLRDVFGLPILAHADGDNRGEKYLAQAVVQDGSRIGEPASTMVMPGDMAPTIGVLCLAQERGDSRGEVSELGLSHAVALNDDSQPGLVVLTPPLPLRRPRQAVFGPFSGQARLTSASAPRRQVGPAAVLRQRTNRISDATMLFPVSPALSLTVYEPSALRLLIEVAEAPENLVLRTLDALAMQSCASALHVILVGETTLPEPVLCRATQLFGSRVGVEDSWASALEAADEPISAVLHPGVILHDWRTLAVLADMVEGGAATASCPLVRSTPAGKGWTVQIVANGLVPERPVDAYTQALIETSGVLWGALYPVREPLAGLWLARTRTLKAWAERDIHRLDRSDGEHWCVASTVASVTDGWSEMPRSFHPPIADPSVHCSVRVIKG